MQGPDAQYEFILERSTGADEAFINHDTIATTLKIYTAHLYTRHNIAMDIFEKCRYIDNRYGLSIYQTPLPVNQFYNVQFGCYVALYDD